MGEVCVESRPESGLRREIGTFALMATGLGSIIGSGWLFGAWRTAGIAGPAAVWAWVIGAVVITAIALTYAELGTMLPEPGGMVRFTHISHGPLAGFLASWANWISVVSVIPVEAEASVQYMSSWPYPWAQALYVHAADGKGELASGGIAIAAVLVLVYFGLNFWGVKLFARSNSAITTFKLVIPALTAVALIASGFHPENFSVGVSADPFGNLAGVLTAVATAGIVFSFNGFQSPLNMAGEAHKPSTSIPIAVLGSIGIATVVYVLLQIGYLGSVPTELLATHGWHGIDFSSPFAQLALLANLNWLAILLYIDAFVSPSGTGITYTASTARMIYGMERNGTLPRVFGRIDAKFAVPRPAMWFNLLVSFVFLFFFRGWGTLAAVISVATIVSYLTGPVSAAAFRIVAPQVARPFRLPGMAVIAGFAFVLATELLYWAKWPLTGRVIVLMIVALPVYAYYQRKSGRADLMLQLRTSLWLVVYFPVMALVSWAGSPKFGGSGILPFGWDLVIVGVVGLVFYLWGVRSAKIWAGAGKLQWDFTGSS
jgi:amino acid transporter